MSLSTDYTSRDLGVRQFSQYAPIKGLHWIVVSASLIATLAAWHISLKNIDERTRIRFEQQADYATGLFEQQLLRYADALQSGVGFVAGSEEVLPEEWRHFTERIRLEEQFPAIGGMGVVYRVTSDGLDAFIEKQRILRPDFTIRPAVDIDSQKYQQYLMPLTLIAPQELEEIASGLDAAREARRRNAIERSIKSGSVQITAPITPENTVEPGIVMIAPIFQSTQPETEALRGSEFIGAVVAAVTTSKLASGILAGGIRQVVLKVSHDSETIYDELVIENGDVDPQPLITSSRVVPLFGRNWRFDFHSTLSFRQAQNNVTPTLILLGGLIIDALLLLLFINMSRSNHRAVTLGEMISQKSEELRVSNNALEDRNSELEAFSYLVSHDLKAPLRGIRFLADCIEEDVLKHQPDVVLPPDFTDHLKRIQDQVKLAQCLVKGVLQYSGLGSDQELIQKVDVRKLLHSLRIMLLVDKSQLHLNGTFPTFDTYQTQLFQVFMNLISNGYKYHHGEGLAVVTVSTGTCPLAGFYRFTVADNGPGIDKKHHETIFKPFSTLQPKDHSMSSGVGLAIVKKLVTQYGGNIELRSEPGQGTSFSFDWPQQITGRHEREAYDGA